MQVRGTADDPARFPIENPNPVFRAAADGLILFANPASDALLASWGTRVGDRLPAEWQQRIAGTLAVGSSQRVPVRCGEQVLELDLVPIPARNYVNVYGRDVTEQAKAREARETLLAELTQERARLAALAGELQQERELQQMVMEHSQASLVYLDRDFNLLRMNAAYEIACQRPRAEMLGRNHFELFPNAENEAIFRHVRDTGEAVEFLAKPFEFADQPWRGVTYWDWTLTPVKQNGGPVDGLVFSLVDVTERIRAERLSEALNDIHAAISSKLDRGAIMQTLLTRSVDALGSGAGGIGLREGDCWVLRYGIGLPECAFGVAMTDAEAPVSALVAGEMKPVAVLDAEREPELNHRLMDGYGVRAVLALPLVVRDQVVGVLSFNYDHPRAAFFEAEMDFARKLAVSASLALENARLLESESEQRLAAEQHAAELEATLDAISDGVVIYGLDGKILRQNVASARMLGYQPSDRELSPVERRARLGAEMVDNPSAGIEQMAVSRALHGESVRSQLMRLHPAGAPDCPPTYVMVSGAPIRDRDGRVLGAVSSYSDVTELRRARDDMELRVRERTAALAEANQALQYQATLLENVNDAILAYDADLRITSWNRAAERQYGWKAEEVMGAFAPDVVGSQTTEAERSAVVRAKLVDGCWRGEVRHTRRDGTPIIVEATSMALRDVTGRIFAHVTVNRDITERKRAEEELRASREQLQGLSHQLVRLQESERSYVANKLYDDEGQRLAALMLGLGRLEKVANEDKALRGSLAELKQLAEGILADMHSLAVDLRPASLDQLGLAAALGQHVAELGRQHCLTIQTELAVLRGLALSREAETTLYRITEEALSNAVEHSRATLISIMATRHAGRLVLVVEDDGQGFDVEEAERCGRLGLMGMRARAEMLGGCLTLESRLGAGTAVYIDVPLPPV